jgi:hypothetical protein
MCHAGCVNDSAEEPSTMDKITAFGLDIAKNRNQDPDTRYSLIRAFSKLSPLSTALEVSHIATGR